MIWVLKIKSLIYLYNWAKEITAHVIAHYPQFIKIRHHITDPHIGRVDIKSLTNNVEETRRLAK